MNTIYQMVRNDARYAVASGNRCLVYQAYGAASMARKLKKLSDTEWYELKEMLEKQMGGTAAGGH